MKNSALTVAIVGMGPRGSFCLERLLMEIVHQQFTQPVSLVLFEPHEKAGAGSVYDPTQPEYLVMNYASRYVHFWSHDNNLIPQEEQLSLVEWLSLHHPEYADPEGFAPRAWVGAYLHHCLQKLLTVIPDNVQLEWIPEPVVRVQPIGTGWIVATSQHQRTCQEVLLTTGHQIDLQSLGQESLNGQEQVEGSAISQVFPVTRYLSSTTVEPHALVAIKGMALTWVDATLALTEGRGGQFERDTTGRLRYWRSGQEPACLFPFSRTGLVAECKPDFNFVHLPKRLAAVWGSEKDAILQWLSTVVDLRDLGPLKQSLVRSAAAAYVEYAVDQQVELSSDGLKEALSEWLKTRLKAAELSETLLYDDSPRDCLRRSWEQATGQRPLTACWFLREAWRKLYSAMVYLVETRTLSESAWQEFHQLCTEMERLAFGPPPQNVEKILALFEAGLIDDCFSRNSQLEWTGDCWSLNSKEETIEVDTLINAVLPAAGKIAKNDPVYAPLLQQGLLQLMPYNVGVHITESGQCWGAEGKLTQGLSVLGRATEGCVLGNDTLSRTLHGHPALWAKRIVKNYGDLSQTRPSEYVSESYSGPYRTWTLPVPSSKMVSPS